MANYNLTQTGEEVQRILDSVQTIDSSVISGSSHPVTGSAVFLYSAPRLIISVNNYIGDTGTPEDIVSQSVNINDTNIDTWRTRIKRGASPQIVIVLDDDSETLYINSVVVKDTWYPEENNYLILSFYLDNRYVNLTFYAPSDDPGGGS